MLICLIIVLNFIFQSFWKAVWENETISFWEQVVCIALSYTIVLTVVTFINKYCTWRWVFMLLGLPYLRGEYIGMIISSFNEDDDPSKPNMKRFCKATIIQNINALKIEGDFFTDELRTDKTSDFQSFGEEIKKKDNGAFEISYFFSNKGRLLHPDNKKYGLNNHRGVCLVIYNPIDQTIKGEYFTYERSSLGEIALRLQK